ncbi:hypothetical protein QCA50_011287 [Cerrena zonata]|uniref:Uncharacterized protein n=1 Tax=Cerrena zonata TaxID=2478898 RepID=A0AAW0G157_9APHY
MVTEVPMQGTLISMAVWYRGDADVFSLLFGDYDGTDQDSHKELPYCRVRITEGPFINTTFVTYRSMPSSPVSLQLLQELGCVSFQELMDKRIATSE